MYLYRRIVIAAILASMADVVLLALKCKCTQSSQKAPCREGICEATACLMLDHPQSGRHYACSMTRLQDGDCVEKTTKSGATVSICSCESLDYCNYKIWPLNAKENDDNFGNNNDVNDDEDEYSDVGKKRIGPANLRRQVSSNAEFQDSKSTSGAASSFKHSSAIDIHHLIGLAQTILTIAFFTLLL